MSITSIDDLISPLLSDKQLGKTEKLKLYEALKILNDNIFNALKVSTGAEVKIGPPGPPGLPGADGAPGDAHKIRFADNFPGGNIADKIQAAHDDLPTSGGTVDVSGIEGPQTIASSITISKPTWLILGAGVYTFAPGAHLILRGGNVGVRITGRGRNTTKLTIANNYNGNLIIDNNTGGNSRELCIEGFMIDGNKANQTSGDLIHLLHNSFLTLRDLYLVGAYNDAIYLSLGGAGWIGNCDIQSAGNAGINLDANGDMNVSHCQIGQCGYGILAVNDLGNSRISMNEIYQSRISNIYLKGVNYTATTNNPIIIEGNTVTESLGGHNIWLGDSCRNVVVMGNAISNTGAGYSNIFIGASCADISIVNNQCTWASNLWFGDRTDQTGICTTTNAGGVYKVTRVSGVSFVTSGWVGRKITINSVNYVIATVPNAETLTLTTDPGVQTEVTFNVKVVGSDHGIFVYNNASGDSGRIIIAGNSVSNMWRSGIRVDVCNHVQVIGNISINNGQEETSRVGWPLAPVSGYAGIQVHNDIGTSISPVSMTNILIANNICTDLQANKTQDAGITIGALTGYALPETGDHDPANYVKVVNNYLLGNYTNPIFKSSANIWEDAGNTKDTSGLHIFGTGVLFDALTEIRNTAASTFAGLWILNGSYSYSVNIGTDKKFHVTGNAAAPVNLIDVDQDGKLTIHSSSATTGLAIGGFALPVFPNNASAIIGSLVAGDLYRNGSDPDQVCIVH